MALKSLIVVFGLVVLAFGQIPTNGLSAYYAFEGNLNDSTGHALNDGKLYTTIADPFVAGRPGQGLAGNFAGNCDYVVIPNKSSWNLPTDSSTISIWYDAGGCTKRYSDSECILDCYGRSNTGMRREVMLYLFTRNDSGGNPMALLHAMAMTSNNTDTQLLALPCSLSLSGWHNTTLKWEKPAFSFYVDGVLRGSVTATLSGAKLSTNNKTTYFGTDIWTATQCYCGLLDDIRLYNRILSDSEIVLLAREGTAVRPALPAYNCSQDFSVIARRIPASPLFEISSSVPIAGAGVYDVDGRCVRRLAPAVSGAYRVVWDGTSQKGMPAANGLYFLKLRAFAGIVHAARILLDR
jgi:hypothetical protein